MLECQEAGLGRSRSAPARNADLEPPVGVVCSEVKFYLQNGARRRAPARYLVTALLVSATIAFVGWTVWLFADPGIRRYRQVSRDLVIERLAHVEKALEEATVAVAFIPDSPPEAAAERWRSLFLAYRKHLDQLDFSDPSVQAVAEPLHRVFSLVGQAEQIRKNILKGEYAGERRKAEEWNYHRAMRDAAREARAAAARIREWNQRERPGSLAFPLYPLFGSILCLSLLICYLRAQRQIERMEAAASPEPQEAAEIQPPRLAYFEPNGMDALRRFAARVAHNFNNLLTPVTGYADLLLHSLPPSDPNRQDIEAIQKAGNRAAFLARQLLIFAGRQVTKPRETGLNALIRSLEEPVRAALGSGVRLLCELDPQVPQLKLDPAQFEQLLVNLAQNAREAMPEGGLFSISTSFVTRGYALTPPSPLPDPSVLIKIADTGAGMDEDTQRQAFEPFFSAREPGKGLGLGLAAVYGIVRQLGGAIRVMSRPGQGSTFLIYLPVAHPSEGAPPGGRFSVRELSKTPR